MKIRLFVNHIRSPKFERGTLAILIRQIIREEGKEVDNINIVLVDDDYLMDINRRFLKHNFRTDVMSFGLSEVGTIDGEVYVSADRARVQARRYKVSLEAEVLRLIVHGVLHLAGWDDRTRSQKLRMRKRENSLIKGFYEKRKKA